MQSFSISFPRAAVPVACEDSTSVLSRFTPAAFFASVGISKALAGPKAYAKVLEVSNIDRGYRGSR